MASGEVLAVAAGVSERILVDTVAKSRVGPRLLAGWQKSTAIKVTLLVACILLPRRSQIGSKSR